MTSLKNKSMHDEVFNCHEPSCFDFFVASFRYFMAAVVVSLTCTFPSLIVIAKPCIAFVFSHELWQSFINYHDSADCHRIRNAQNLCRVLRNDDNIE